MKLKDKHLNKILPISKLLGVLGIYFTVCSIFYVLIIVFCGNNVSLKTILIIVEVAFAFISMFVTLFIMAIKVNKDRVDSANIKAAEEYKENLNKCIKCAEAKLRDGFHHSGLLTFEELVTFEKSLSSDPNPKQCYVLIYTSDLATEIDASEETTLNLSKGVQYRVLYFRNSCGDKMAAIQQKYGKENLVDLGEYPRYNNSFDGELSDTLGFDIMIYQTSNGVRRGFFAVDFIDDISRHNERKCHIPDCQEKCNYGTDQQTFYKEMSAERTQELYYGILGFFGSPSNEQNE